MKPKTKYIIVVYTLQYYLKLEIKLLNSWAEVLKTQSLHKKSEYLRTGKSCKPFHLILKFWITAAVTVKSVRGLCTACIKERTAAGSERLFSFLFPEKFPFYYFPSSDSSGKFPLWRRHLKWNTRPQLNGGCCRFVPYRIYKMYIIQEHVYFTWFLLYTYRITVSFRMLQIYTIP